MGFASKNVNDTKKATEVKKVKEPKTVKHANEAKFHITVPHHCWMREGHKLQEIKRAHGVCEQKILLYCQYARQNLYSKHAANRIIQL